MLIEMTEKEFKVPESGVALVSFGASWCPDCVRANPFLQTLAQEFNGKAKVIKVSINKIAEIDPSFQIRKIPTLIFYKDGKEVLERIIEPRSIDPIRDSLQKLV